RIHEKPDEAKMNTFFEFLGGLGLGMKGKASDVHPLELQKVLNKVKGEQEELVISKLMLRSMKQAKYDPNSVGHFCLSIKFYTLFTSPIRLYLDLTVHRIIRTILLKGNMSSKIIKKWKDVIPDITKHTTEMERAAVEAE